MEGCPVRTLFLIFASLARAQDPKAAEDSRQAAALLAASETASSQGQYDKVVSLLSEAVPIHARLGDEERVAEDWNGIGRAQIYTGNFQAAVQSFEKALAIDRKRGDVEGEVVRLYNIGNSYYEQGRYSEAYRQYQASVDRVNRAGDLSWVPRRKQIAVSNLAILYQRLGRYQKALELYRSLETSAKAMLPSERAQLLANQGTLYRRLGDPEKALETYRAAQKLFAQDRHPFGEINVLRNIGIAQALDQRRLPDALKTFDEARKLAARSEAASQLPPTTLYVAEALREMGRLAEAGREFESALKGARALKSRDYEWRALFGLGQIEQAAGRANEALRYYADAIGAVESVRSNLGISTLRRDFLADKRQVYDAAISLRAQRTPPPLEEIFELMERSRARILQDTTGSAQLKAIQSRLPQGALLLEFWMSAAGGAVLAVTRDSASLLPRPAVAAEPLRDAAFQGGDWKTASEQTGRALLDGLPVLSDPSLRNVIIVPDGALALLPFELLRVPGSGQILLERAAVSYLPSASLMLHPDWGRQPPSPAPPWRNQLAAFADPEQLGPGLFAEASNKPLSRLPMAVEEVRYIAGLAQGRAEVHTGPAATKPELVSAASRGFPLLHVATHAIADYTDPERSRILLSSPKLSEAADFLFLREIYALNLRHCDLIVLSACDTETGKVVSGEGVEGFGKAFLTAGARSTVSTLWRVGDSASSELMKQFYHALLSGETKAEALRIAKLRFFHRQGELAHPRHWAAFVLSGDGLTPAPPYWGWRWPLIVAAALAAGLFTVRKIR